VKILYKLWDILKSIFSKILMNDFSRGNYFLNLETYINNIDFPHEKILDEKLWQKILFQNVIMMI
jgi:hypothetical protein